MAKEHDLYRLQCERLDEAFPNKELLTVSERQHFLGIGKTAYYTRYATGQALMSKLAFAKQIVEGDSK